jgi:hypothetical protein
MSVSRSQVDKITARASTLRVDKGRFLLLATALAAGACSSSDESNGSPAATSATSAGGSAGSGGRGTSSTAASSAAAGGRGGSSGGSSGAAGSIDASAGSSGAGGLGGSGGASMVDAAADASGEKGSAGGAMDASVKDSTADAPAKDGSESEASTKDGSSAEGSTKDASGDAAACLGTSGTPGTCTGLFPACTWQADYCVHLAGIAKGGVAQAAVSCIEGLAGTCDSFAVYGCLRTALGKACFDATASTLCSTIEGSCFSTNPIGSADCHKLVDGLSDSSRVKVQDCIVGGSCQLSLWSCIEGIF